MPVKGEVVRCTSLRGFPAAPRALRRDRFPSTQKRGCRGLHLPDSDPHPELP